MKLADCTPGSEVVIGMRFMMIGLHGLPCTVLETRPAPDNPAHNPGYPHGMVKIRLPEDADWPEREPWIGPEDLARRPW